MGKGASQRPETDWAWGVDLYLSLGTVAGLCYPWQISKDPQKCVMLFGQTAFF